MFKIQEFFSLDYRQIMFPFKGSLDYFPSLQKWTNPFNDYYFIDVTTFNLNSFKINVNFFTVGVEGNILEWEKTLTDHDKYRYFIYNTNQGFVATHWPV